MPNRYLREGILDSENFNSASALAQLVLMRCLLIVDDWGRHPYNVQLIRNRAFPIYPQATEELVGKALKELARRELITIYDVEEKMYFKIEKGQERRPGKAKYPNQEGFLEESTRSSRKIMNVRN